MMNRKFSSSTFLGITVFSILSVVAPSVWADSWVAPPAVRTVWALDKTAKAVVTFEGPDWWAAGVQSQVSVWLTSRESGEKLLWKGNLLNIPHRIFVSPYGKWVVTMDKWGGVGQDPVVFYDSAGHLVKRYPDPKEELLTEQEIPRIKRSVSSYWWSEDAHAEFTTDAGYFLLWLAWGRVVVFESNNGQQVDAQSFRLDSNQRTNVLETVNLLKKSQDPDVRIAASRFAGWLGGKIVWPILEELLKDPYYRDDPWQKVDDPWERFGDSYMWVCPRRYPVRKAAAEEMHIHFGQARGVIQEWVAR